ncbi:hypothetical protein Leryth_019420, partial [Lithospermum erythrorhizon]
IDDPLFFHSSDHSSLILVTDPLTDLNYTSWSRAMRIALEARDKYGFLTGEVEPVNDVKFRQWRKVNSTLISLILNSVSRDIGRDFMFADDAKMLWNEFKEAFGACNGPKLYELMRNLYSINDSVARYS